MLVGISVNPFSSPSTTYITEPIKTVSKKTASKKTLILRRLARKAVEMTFAFEDLTELFLTPLREELEREGVTIDQTGVPIEEQRQRE